MQIKPPQFFAVSNEPKENDKMSIHRLDYGKPFTLQQGEGDVYIKYPYVQKYILSVESRYKQNKKKYVSRIETMIPKND